MVIGRRQQLAELSRAEAMSLLAGAPAGRLVFTSKALPAIRPVNHQVSGDLIVIGLSPGSAVAASAAGAGTVVAYEADDLDPVSQSGWSVIVVGIARLVADQAAAEQYRASLQSWLSGADADILLVQAELVTGYRLGAT